MQMDKSYIENQALFSSIMVFDQCLISRKRNEDGTVEQTMVPPGAMTRPDGSMEFNYYAPDAKRVQVVSWGGSMPKQELELVNRGDGWFTGVTDNVRSGFHYHDYLVDGVSTLNPRAPIGYGGGRFANFCETAGEDLDFYFLKDVPHGTVRMDVYKSEVCGGRYRNCWVYTPPGYETDTDQRYPVLYIQHGGGENEVGWIWQGKMNFILDNLIAEDKCVPFIAVCNCSDAAFAPTEEEDVYRNVDFSDMLAKDCIPFIDAKYRTIDCRHKRAMAGLSMGVVYSYMTVFKYPELFANVGFFSGHVMPRSDGEYFGKTFDYSEVFENVELFNSRLDLMFHTCGDQESPTRLREFAEPLKEKGMNVEFMTFPGYHEWDVWRHSVYQFAQRLFRKQA